MIWEFVAGDALSARRSRAEFLRALRDAASPNADLYAAEMIFGELVANVVRHASGPVRIELRCNRPRAILSVTDHGGGFEAKPARPHELSEKGRGLYLVNALAERVTVKRKQGNGSCVTVTLPVRL